MIIGIDEVGRGCWAGPLLAAAVGLEEGLQVPGLRDSKKLTAKKRLLLVGQIQSATSSIGVGWVWPKEINKIGLTESVRLAMQRAVDQIDLADSQVIIDGNYNYLPDVPNSSFLIQADDRVQAVAAASVIAKVLRDTYMKKLSETHPGYGFEKHVGYGTKLHQEALLKFGVLQSIHRLNYKPIKKLLQQ
ncbi:ribonuclease HII [Candidatus Saccharibacteria bacterium]|nr:ribonuclease HII [Candidatus Saccharibacteria bacterium]